MDSLSDRNYTREELNVRQAFEQIYKQKLKEIQQFYSEQNKSLKATLQQAYKKVLSDELLITMIGDKTTSKFIEARVDECFQDIVFNERQIIIENQNIQITELKFRLEEMSRKMDKMYAQNTIKQNSSHREKAVVQGKYTEMSEELRRKSQELLKCNLKIKSLQSELEEKEQQLSKVWEENDELKKTLEHIDSDLKQTIDANIEKYQNQNSELTKYRQTVHKLQKKLKQTEEALQQAQQHSGKTIGDYKTKIEQYKQKMTQLINSKDSLLPNKSSVSLGPTEMQKRLAETIKQNEKRFQQLKEQKQKQRNELERKYESRQRQTQVYYQKLLQKKVAEVQNQASEFWEMIKKEEASLRQLIKNYEENYVSNEEHQRLMNEREQLIIKMKEKLEEYEETIDDHEQKIDQFGKTIAQYEATLEERVSQIHKLQASLTEQMTIAKKYEAAITELKSQNKRTQQKLNNLQQQLSKQSSKLTSEQSTNIKSSQDINFYQKQIKEKQLKCKEINDQLEDQERKSKKLENQLMIVNANYNEIQALFKDNKRVLAELEFKIKQLEHDAQLTTNEYAHKTKKMVEEVTAKTQEISNLSSQYKSMQQDFLTLKAAHTELETTNKKLTLEIKYTKDTELTVKQDFSTQIIDLKNRINQKVSQIQQLKNQLQKNQQRNSDKIQEQIEIKKSAEKRMKDCKKALGLIQKHFISLANDLRKELDTIRTQIKNNRIIHENQVTLQSRTFAIQSMQVMRNIDHSLNQRVLEQNKRFQQEKRVLADKTLMSRQEMERELNVLMEKEKQQLMEVIKQKQKELNKVQGENRGLHYELQNKKQQLAQQQKAISSLQGKLARQQQDHMKNIRSLSNDFQNQKSHLLQQYEQKRDITANQIQQLSKTIQKLRIQMQTAKSNYDQEKLHITSQLRSIQEQEHVVKETAYKKDEEMKRLDEQLRKTFQHKNYLQHSLRELSENDQRKMMRIHQLQFAQNQLNQSLNLLKVKLERTEEENSLLKQTLKENEENVNRQVKNRVKVQNELKDIKAAIDRNDKFRDLRALQQMTVETQELTNKVNQMKRMSQYLDRTPLRS